MGYRKDLEMPVSIYLIGEIQRFLLLVVNFIIVQ